MKNLQHTCRDALLVIGMTACLSPSSVLAQNAAPVQEDAILKAANGKAKASETRILTKQKPQTSDTQVQQDPLLRAAASKIEGEKPKALVANPSASAAASLPVTTHNSASKTVPKKDDKVQGDLLLQSGQKK